MQHLRQTAASPTRNTLALLWQRAEIQAREHRQEHRELKETLRELRRHKQQALQWRQQQAQAAQRISTDEAKLTQVRHNLSRSFHKG